VEKLAAMWDFRGAAVELGKIRLEEPELAARLAQRRDELKRMHDLKQKIIAAINAASPPLKKSVLGIKGLGGEVPKADEAGLKCKLINGKAETFEWAHVGSKAVPKLVELAADRASPDDWLAAGLVGVVCQDLAFAEKCFDQARSLGAEIKPYLGPLASAAFCRAEELLDKKQFSEADAALGNLEENYRTIPWFQSHAKLVAAARAAAKAGIHENEGEALYAEAADLFAHKEFFDLKPLVEKLKTDYPMTQAVIDAARKPSFADLERATLNLGKRFIVRKDGKGDFTSIQAAIDAAATDNMIQIDDNAIYVAQLDVPAQKQGLTIRGKRGRWPIISSVGLPNPVRELVKTAGPRTTLEGLVLSHGFGFEDAKCVEVLGGPLLIRSCVLWGGSPFDNRPRSPCELKNCFLVGSPWFSGPIAVSDSIWLGTPGSDLLT
jgi:hypothetical protein